MQIAIADRSLDRTLFEDRGRAVLIAAAAALLAASLAYTPLVLMLLLGLPAALYFATRPFELLLFTTFMIPFNFVFVVGGIPVAMELLKVALGILFALQLLTSPRRFVRSRYQRPLLVILALLLYSCLVAGNLPFVLKESVRLGSSLGLCVVAANLIDSREKLRLVLKSIGISSFLVAVYGLYQFAIQDFGWLFWLVNPRVATALAPSRAVFYDWRNRITSVLTGEMEAGVYFNYCLPLAGALFLSARARAERIFWGSTLILLFLGLLLTFTFGAWSALAAALLYLTWRFRKRLPWRPAFALLGLIGVAGGAVLAANYEVMMHRMELIAYDAWTRWEFWTLAWSEFKAHPIIGGGLGSFGPLVAASNFEWLERLSPEWASTMSPHNAYMYVLSQFGLAGVLCIFGIFLHAVRAMLRLGREAGREPGDELRWIALGLALSLLTALAGSLTDDGTLFGSHCGSMIWLVVGLTEVVARLGNQDSFTRVSRSSSHASDKNPQGAGECTAPA